MDFEQDDIAVCMVLGGFAGMFLSVFFTSSTLCILAFMIVIIGIIIIIKDKIDSRNAHIANINTFQTEYDEYTDKLDIVKSEAQVTLIETDEYDIKSSILQYIWIKNDNLYIFPASKYYKEYRTSSTSRPDLSELGLKKIPVPSILYFEEVGEMCRYKVDFREKTTLKTYFLGEAVFDASGEVKGVREPIQSKIVSKDYRRVRLVYNKSENEIKTLVFQHDAYEIFRELIPEKELANQ